MPFPSSLVKLNIDRNCGGERAGWLDIDRIRSDLAAGDGKVAGVLPRSALDDNFSIVGNIQLLHSLRSLRSGMSTNR